MKAQIKYSPETLRKIYDKLLKTPSKKMSEPMKFKIGGKMKKKGGELKESQRSLPPFLKKEIAKSDGKVTDKEKEVMKKKKGGCVGPKYMCGGKHKK